MNRRNLLSFVTAAPVAAILPAQKVLATGGIAKFALPLNLTRAIDKFQAGIISLNELRAIEGLAPILLDASNAITVEAWADDKLVIFNHGAVCAPTDDEDTYQPGHA